MSYLQSLSGLSDIDPLHRYLGIVDKIGEIDWTQVGHKIPQKGLIDALWFYLGHPVDNSKVSDAQLDQFEKYLRENEELSLAGIISKLKRKELQPKGFHKIIGDLDNHGLRCVFMFIIANLETITFSVVKLPNLPKSVTDGQHQHSSIKTK